MFQHARIHMLLTCLASILVASCVPPPATPPVLPGPAEADRVARALQARTTGVRTLTAVLSMAFSGAARQGTFAMIVHYEASGRMRFTAFKDLIISSRPIFDLLFTPQTYRLELHEAGETSVHEGPLAAFVERHAPFRAFFIIAEGFFLPGFDHRGVSPVLADAAEPVFTTQLRSGVPARWFVEPRTLEVEKAQIAGFLIEYGGYRHIGVHAIPGLVVLRDQHSDFTSRAVLRQVEINAPLAPDAFDISWVPKWHTGA